MTFTDYLLNGTLVALVLLQVRARRLTTWMLLRPILIVAVIAASYLRGVPTQGNDLLLALVGAGAGTLLGTCCGLATDVFRDKGGPVIIKAGALAALLWIAGVGSRIAFTLYTQHGGGTAVTRFSVANHITGAEAWVACLVLMGVMEVTSRTTVLAWRRRSLQHSDPAALPVAPQQGLARSMIGLDGRWS
ncbi:MAG: hypothetical protein ABSD85_06240 [Acidimicrobiales bacterium]|jgi:hypothetical protein